MSKTLATLPADHFDGRLDELQKVIPTGDRQLAEHMARMVLTAINKTPALVNTTPESRLACLFDIVTIGLEPNTPAGLCFLIPYGNQCTLQIGVNGFCKLAYDSNQVKIIKSDTVRQGDKFDYANSTTGAFVNHTKAIGRGRCKEPLLAVWASIELLNGGVFIEVLDADESDKILRLSKAPAAKQWEDEWRRKSALKRALKRLQIGGMSIVQKAVEIDNRNTPVLQMPKPKMLTFDDGEQPKQIGDAPTDAADRTTPPESPERENGWNEQTQQFDW